MKCKKPALEKLREELFDYASRKRAEQINPLFEISEADEFGFIKLWQKKFSKIYPQP